MRTVIGWILMMISWACALMVFIPVMIERWAYTKAQKYLTPGHILFWKEHFCKESE